MNLGDVARDQGGNLDVEDPKVEERMMEVLATEVEALVRCVNANGTQAMGLDLEPEDYAWTARKVCEVADICCNGRVVSVLEGGYGRTAPPNPSPLSSVPTPPLSVVENPATEPDRQKLDKSFFSECAMQHLKGLVDPYFTDEHEQADSLERKEV